jgi:hypothetical protein
MDTRHLNGLRHAWLWIILAASLPLRAAYTLPDYMKTDIGRIAETWNILDQYAARIWPGWTNYTSVPFLLEYPNGVQLLIGHPSPPDGFEAVADAGPRGKTVHVNRSREIPLACSQPLLGGGGIIPYGKGKALDTVSLLMRPVSTTPPPADAAAGGEPLPKELRQNSELQILIDIHELFHCFQHTVYSYRFGNLQANSDANFAQYAEIEGLALERAYLEPSMDKAKLWLGDFLAARLLKRDSLTKDEQNQEAEDDLMEGTAVYSEARALELMQTGYRPLLTAAADPFFKGFAQIGAYLKEKLTALKNSRVESMDARMKCYHYGCFQSLLLARLFPSWQDDFFAQEKFLDQVLTEKLGLNRPALEKIAATLPARYPVAAVAARHQAKIKQRDDALALIEARHGRTYILNFKPTHEYIHTQGAETAYVLGLINIYPQGVAAFRVNDVEFKGHGSPLVIDQLYYVKWIDTEAKAGQKGYTLRYAHQEAGDVYIDAEFVTAGFTLKAPKLQIKDTPERVKVTILSRVRGG